MDIDMTKPTYTSQTMKCPKFYTEQEENCSSLLKYIQSKQLIAVAIFIYTAYNFLMDLIANKSGHSVHDRKTYNTILYHYRFKMKLSSLQSDVYL